MKTYRIKLECCTEKKPHSYLTFDVEAGNKDQALEKVAAIVASSDKYKGCYVEVDHYNKYYGANSFYGNIMGDHYTIVDGREYGADRIIYLHTYGMERYEYVKGARRKGYTIRFNDPTDKNIIYTKRVVRNNHYYAFDDKGESFEFSFDKNGKHFWLDYSPKKDFITFTHKPNKENFIDCVHYVMGEGSGDHWFEVINR